MALKKPNPEKPALVFLYPERAELIKQGKCPLCKAEIKEEDFRDELSKDEYSISGMCQSCQDETFGV